MIGKCIHDFARDLWPLNRSLSGEGVRETLQMIKQHLPTLEIKEVQSGTEVFDWIVPKEWSVEQAYIKTPSGKKICDFGNNNLHLVGYSIPHSSFLTLDELKQHLYTLPEQPKAIPYVTSYYKDRWGFCISFEEYERLEEGVYEVCVDTELFDGVINYGELKIPGKKPDEVFLSSYVCHPSMANNELSGPSVLTFISKWLQQKQNLEYSYRIVFVPETIGSICYVSRNLKEMKQKIFAGFNVSCVGDDRSYSFLPSRNGKTLSDRVAKHVLSHIDNNYSKFSWFDRGSDERQYCSPGVDLPIASIMRTMYGCYPEYHTSLDDLENVVTPDGLNGGYWAIRRALDAIECNRKLLVTTICEPQLGRRNLYPTLLTGKYGGETKLMMDLISMCDGTEDLIEIAEQLAIPIWDLNTIALHLEDAGILERVEC